MPTNHSKRENSFSDVLVMGRGRLASSIPVCVAASGSRVTLCQESSDNQKRSISTHAKDLTQNKSLSLLNEVRLAPIEEIEITQPLAIIVGYSQVSHLQEKLEYLEAHGTPNLIIAIATDHIPLSRLQENRRRPENIIVVNWTEPAHTTFFLEMVYNSRTSPEVLQRIEYGAIHFWGKDPYKVKAELGVRGRMNAALTREALYLIDKGYANVEDIDRACRNDAGTYLPFAGNFQYMDLMGTYAYGVVMEQLNRELSNATRPPAFFDIKEENIGHNGESIETGFYQYSREDFAKWETRMRNFSFEVRAVMEKYPFEYLEEPEQ